MTAMKGSPCRNFFPVGSLRFNISKFFCRAAVLLLAAQTLIGSVRAADSADHTTGSRKLSIAAAANLVYVLDALNAAFRGKNQSVSINVALGASGSLVAQIRHGAPYDVFLSADRTYPQSLIDSGDADAKSLMTFAHGELVLWTNKPDLKLSTLDAVLRDPAVKKIAIANPQTAPYGRAAKQVLEHLGAWTTVQPRIVFGENIAQTAQFVETGNADIGFVALSLLMAPQMKSRGSQLRVSADWYDPLAQAAVLTRRGVNNDAARQYLAFLASDEARAILQKFGYSAPSHASPKRSSIVE